MADIQNPVTSTEAKVIQIDSDEVKIIPYSYVRKINEDNLSHMLMICSHKFIPKLIRLFPCFDKVTKIIMNIRSIDGSKARISPEFLKKLGDIFSRLAIKVIWNSGLCYTAYACVYELYCDNQQFDLVPLKQLINEFKQLPGVTEVIAYEVEISA